MTTQPDDGAGVSNQLRIPQAQFRPHGADSAREVTPIDVLEEGLQDAPGLFLCPACLDLLDPRVRGSRRTPYFAHKQGHGLDCERRSEGGWEYTTISRANWQRAVQSRVRVLPIELELVPRKSTVMLVGRGRALSSDELAQLPTDAQPATTGTIGAPSRNSLHWSRASFAVKVTDPLACKVAITGPTASTSWKPEFSGAEISARVIAFVAANSEPARHAAAFTGTPLHLWLLAENSAAIMKVGHRCGVALSDSDFTAFSIEGSSQWMAARLERDWREGAPRKLLRELGVHLGTKQQPLVVLPLSGEATRGPAVTILRTETGDARFLIKTTLSSIVVEIVPLPYHPESVARKTIDHHGYILHATLDDPEKVANFYVVALDPSHNDRYLAEHRVTVARDTESVPIIPSELRLGLCLGDRLVISPSDRRVHPWDFRDAGSIRLAVPPRASDGEAIFPSVEVRGYREMNPDVSPAWVNIVQDADEFAEALRVITADRTVQMLGVKFDKIGEVRLVSAEAEAIRRRPEIRAALASELWLRFQGTRTLSASSRGALIETVVPKAARNYGWESELNAMHKLIYKHKGRTAPAAGALREYLSARGNNANALPTLEADDDPK